MEFAFPSPPGGCWGRGKVRGASLHPQQLAPAAGLSHALSTGGVWMDGSTSLPQAKARDGFFVMFPITLLSQLEVPMVASQCQEVGFVRHVAVGSSGLLSPRDGRDA